MYKRLALWLVLMLILSACAGNEMSNNDSTAGARGSEIARPGPAQAGVIGR